MVETTGRNHGVTLKSDHPSKENKTFVLNFSNSCSSVKKTESAILFVTKIKNIRNYLRSMWITIYIFKILPFRTKKEVFMVCV